MAATIPRAALDYVTEQINRLSADAKARVMRVLERIDWSDVATARALVVQALQMELASSTALAAQASADFYDASRELAVGAPLGARAYSGYDPDATEGAVRAFTQRIVDGKPVEVFNRLVLARVDWEMKRAAGYSMTENAAHDSLNPRYARVPTGAETCDFCLMLASRGFVYRSKESAGAVNHYHESCDCRVVVGWTGMEVEGYDPQAIYDRWQDAIDEKARERAERKGTDLDTERDAIMRAYGDAAKRAKRAGRKKA